jgi:hypothetical protein
MPCSFKEDEEKKRFVMRVVREAIKRVDGGTRPVTQRTWLGPNGLGHLAPRRRLYCGEINTGLAENAVWSGVMPLRSNGVEASGSG